MEEREPRKKTECDAAMQLEKCEGWRGPWGLWKRSWVCPGENSARGWKGNLDKGVAAAKSFQSCLTLCNPIDGSPPGSAIPGILQARTLPSLGFSRQEHSVQPHRWQPTRLCRPWDSPGKNTGVGCQCLLRFFLLCDVKSSQELKVFRFPVEVEIIRQSGVELWDLVLFSVSIPRYCPEFLKCVFSLINYQHSDPNRKRSSQVCVLSPCLFNLYAEYIMRNPRLDEAQAGIKIAGRNINNLRYVDDISLIAESEELKSLLMKVKEERVKKLA